MNNQPANNPIASTITVTTNSNSGNNLLSLLSGNKELVKLLERADLVDTIRESVDQLTMFAPTDQAFTNLPPAVMNYLIDPKNKQILQQILLYHVINRTSNLAGLPYPPIIQIDTVLIPPNLQEMLANLTSNPVATTTNKYTLPKWINQPRPGNNL
jgi:hypothetical protein